MIRYLLIFLQSLVLFLLGLFTGDNGVSISHNIPASIAAGEEVRVVIKIAKGELAGFAKLQMEFPEGITIKESEDVGATYTFEDGIAKWVWATVPAEGDMLVPLVLVAAESAMGVQIISAKFSYVENNTKQLVQMQPAEVNVTGPVAATTPNPVAAVAAVAGADSLLQTRSGNKEPDGKISAERTVTGKENNSVLVQLTIKKGATRGFARYSDDLPEGLTARAVETDGSSFSIADGKLKFVWVNAPEKEELKIAYTLQGTAAAAVLLKGEYSYLEDNQSKKYLLDEETITLGAAALAATPTPPKTAPAAPVTPAVTAGRQETAINYHVQIGAFTNKKVTAARLKKLFRINEPVSSEMQGGFSKFMVGKYDVYKTARDHRENVVTGNGIKSAFVVAYNHGKRITVQEALMITSQKWFK